MPKLSSAKRDDTKATEGVWFDSEVIPGVQWLIVPSDHPEYREYLQRHEAQLAKMFDRRGKLKPAAARAAAPITARAAAILLRDWRNVEDDDGEPLPYTRERAEAILTDDAYAAILAEVTMLAADEAAFRVESIESAAGN